MDGNDVAPPVPPKYGDLRLHIDTKAVHDFQVHEERLAAARARISGSVTRMPLISEVESSDADEETPSQLSNTDIDAPQEPNVPSASTEEGSTMADAGLADAATAGAPTNEAPSEPTPVPTEGDDEMPHALPDATSSDGAQPDTPMTDEPRSSEATCDDYAMLKEYNDAYEQSYNVVTGETRYTIIQEASSVQSTQGIGGRHMTLQERELDFKRWQTALLQKIPEQPLAADLGLANRVFYLEERRRALTSEAENEEDSDDSKDSDDVMEEEEEEEGEVEKKSDSKDSTMKKSKNTDEEEHDAEESDDDAGDDKKEEPLPPKIIKPMSLLPLPSFYEQDMKRIRLVHADLMATSIHEHARRRIAECTNDYNQAFRVSNDLYNQRIKLQNDVNAINHSQRMEISKVKNDYAMQVTLARARWQKRKEAWELQKAKKAMQGMYGQMPIGTSHTQHASRHHNQIYNTVGLALGRIVDAVVLKVEGGLSDGDQFEPFVPPPSPNFDGMIVNEATGETFGDRSRRVENSARNQLQSLSTRLQQSEEDRKRAWRKLLKTKAEYEVPSAGNRRRLDQTAINAIPVPPLRGSSVVPPSAAQYQPAPVAAYVPPVRHNPLEEDSAQSKYSAARVRERIAEDGTVKPVTMPKRDKDGLYMRPAGRTRKGMNWDAVRGMWVPMH